MKLVLTALLLLAAITSACRTNESPEGQINDAEIATSIKAKLASDLGVSSITNISVNSTQGVVTLAGTVHSAEEKSRAVAIARSIPKVVKVNDNLQVTAGS
jgi:hyperosmotically inducible protein